MFRWWGVQWGGGGGVGREQRANVRGESLTESFCNLCLGLEME